MKKLLFPLFLVLGSTTLCLAQDADTPATETVTTQVTEHTPKHDVKDTFEATRSDTEHLLGLNEYRHTYGAENNIAGIVLLCIIAILTTVLLCIIVRKGNFNLKEALSENVQDRRTLPNPAYVNDLPKILMAFNNPDSGVFKALKEKSDQDRLAANDAKQARIAAEQALAAAADDQKATAQEDLAKAKETEGQLNTTAEASMRALSGLTLTPAMLNNLSGLFPPTIEVSIEHGAAGAHPTYRPSASRLIAFLSAMFLFIVGLSSTCFFLYFYLVNGVPPDLGKLTGILIALGIGMAPYAVSKVVNPGSDKGKSF